MTEERDPITGESNYSVGTIVLVFFNLIIGIFTLGNAGPLISTIATARAAGYEVFNIINRVKIIYK